ncbi:MAG: DUF6275 family protein [Peptoniphilus senegalensis]
MTNERFIELAKEKVRDYENDRVDLNFTNVQIEDIFVVWSCKTLQNSKALLSAKHKGAFYYEFTYNGDKEEVYMDIYKKVANIPIDVKEE